jgi:hypothetical protein
MLVPMRTSQRAVLKIEPVYLTATSIKDAAPITISLYFKRRIVIIKIIRTFYPHPQNWLTMDEPNSASQRFIETQTYFRGSAKIAIRSLEFGSQEREGVRLLEGKNVSRLLKIFETEGCDRLDPEHHIAALIGQDAFNRALQISRLERATLMDREEVPPRLELDADDRITCLHGQHRIEAAKQYLNGSDKWWIVDLYLEGIVTIPAPNSRELP